MKKKRTECHKKSVRKEWIEDLVVSKTMKMVMDDKAIEAIVSVLMDLQGRENVNLPLYEQQLQGGGHGHSKPLERHPAGHPNQAHKRPSGRTGNPGLPVGSWQSSRCDGYSLSTTIFLYDDRMVITLNYKDGTDTHHF